MILFVTLREDYTVGPNRADSAAGREADIRHYPFLTRTLLRLWREGRLDNVKHVWVEPVYGFVGRVVYLDGRVRMIYQGDHGACSSAARRVANDKGHTKAILRSLGVATVRGIEVAMPWWAEALDAGVGNRGTLTVADAVERLRAEFTYPVVVKPGGGSLGRGVHRAGGEAELATVFARFEERRVRIAIVEETIDMPEYRIVVHDDALVAAYRRTPPTVLGDGRRTAARLLEDRLGDLAARNRHVHLDPADPRVAETLAQQGYGLGDRIPAGTPVRLLPVANLSAGGDVQDVTGHLHPRWAELARHVARAFALPLCGLDLFCDDITSPDARHAVLEVNAVPGLDHFASAGPSQRRISDDLHARILNTPPPAHGR